MLPDPEHDASDLCCSFVVLDGLSSRAAIASGCTAAHRLSLSRSMSTCTPDARFYRLASTVGSWASSFDSAAIPIISSALLTGRRTIRSRLAPPFGAVFRARDETIALLRLCFGDTDTRDCNRSASVNTAPRRTAPVWSIREAEPSPACRFRLRRRRRFDEGIPAPPTGERSIQYV